MADKANRKKEANDPQAHDGQSPAVLTGHTNEAGVVEDPVTGKVQARHETTVVTDPESELAVQGQDDPRVNGGLADPLRRDPSPNEVAEGADSESNVTVSGADDEQARAGQLTDEDQDADKS